MEEVNLTAWMPEGWSGTADYVFYNAEARGFVLGDLKTIKGDGITWIERDGARVPATSVPRFRAPSLSHPWATVPTRPRVRGL